MGWLISFLIRLASGERFRKATPRERRLGAAFLLFAPVFMFAFVWLGHSLLDRAGPVGVWLYMMSGIFSLGVCVFLWARYVKAMVSLILALIVWGVAFWLAFTNRLPG